MNAPTPVPPSGAWVSRAPGKLILSGEHAVVYGKPGLAAACRRFATVSVAPRAEPGLEVALPDLRLRRTWSVRRAEAQYDSVRRRHRAFLEGRAPIEQVLQDPTDLVLAATIGFFREQALPVPDGFQVSVTSTLPPSAGMGSSAAILVAALHAWSRVAGRPLSIEELARSAAELEQLAHGRSSGIDPALCAHGGTIHYEKGLPVRPVGGGVKGLWIVQTGRPVSGTGECVARVAATHAQSPIWGEFAAVTRRMETAWTHGDRAAFAAEIRENHRLLLEIGVVPRPVADFIRSVQGAGGAAKVCGAGAVRGSAAGAVLVCADMPPEALCLARGYEGFAFEPEPGGVREDPAPTR